MLLCYLEQTIIGLSLKITKRNIGLLTQKITERNNIGLSTQKITERNNWSINPEITERNNISILSER